MPRSPANFFRILLGSKDRSITALDKVNLETYKGELFGLLGPNGAGKTTLIKILCTLVLPDSGTAFVNGYDVIREPKMVLRNLQAVLGEGRGFEWRLSARKSMEFYAAMYGQQKDEAERKIDYLLEFAGLKSRSSDMIQKFSTGMHRRLLVCRALLANAPILLFDEPTIGLDPVSASSFRSLLRDRLCREQGRTIFMSTHNLGEAETMCDRVAIIHRGRIVAVGTPDEIRKLVGHDVLLTIGFEPTLLPEKQRQLLHDLNQIDSVKSLQPLYSDDGGLIRITIRARKNPDLTELLGQVIELGVRISSVETSSPSLEEAFLRLTRSDAA